MIQFAAQRRSFRTRASEAGSTRWTLEPLEPRTFFSATLATDPVDLVAQANNAFAFDLYRQLHPDDSGNLFFSPYSIATALEMTLQGANGTTADEIIQALHLPPDAIAQAGIQALYQLFQADPATAGYTLSTANRLWVKDNFPLLESFLTKTRDDFGAAPQSMDFSNPKAAADIINAWVSDQTHGKIPALIPPEFINDYTRLILTNAIYFKGDWASTFDAAATRDSVFHVTPTEGSNDEMMFQDNTFGYYAQYGAGGFQALDLPYKGNNLDMLVILPNASTLDGFESNVTPELLSQITSNLKPTDVDVFLPKFKMSETYNLVAPLENLGIRTAFGDNADFSGITNAERLYISGGVHMSFIQVDETGTEAAAATGFGMSCTSIAFPYTPPVEFRADHPFLFAIRDRSTGTILFLGQVSNPGTGGTFTTPPTTPTAPDPTPPAPPPFFSIIPLLPPASDGTSPITPADPMIDQPSPPPVAPPPTPAPARAPVAKTSPFRAISIPAAARVTRFSTPAITRSLIELFNPIQDDALNFAVRF